jgi:Domain of unknown function (DUF4160)
MPRVKIPNIPWRVSFYSFDLRERRHVHVFRERMECKVWIEDGIEVAWNRGFSEAETNAILRMIESNLSLINETYERLLA